MQFQITALYAAILAVMMIVLRTIVTVRRAKTGISIHHGDDMLLAERIRWHGNFVENVPMAVILMGLAEIGGASQELLHSAGGALVASRLLHPFGLRHDKAATPSRIISGVGTTAAMLVCIGFILWQRAGN